MNHEDDARRLRNLLATRGITDERVLDAIEHTPRERFLPAALHNRAYEDNALPIGAGQTISQPYIVALMTQELSLAGDERVLEIGTGSGYQAAILCRLCRELVTVERHAELFERARSVLLAVGCANVEFYVGDGTLGCPERAPFDAIIVTAAAPAPPPPLYEQLAPGGRMVIPVGGWAAQSLLRMEKHEEGPRTAELCGCRFVQLIGAAGWQEQDELREADVG